MKSIRVLVSALTLQSALISLHAQSPVIYSFGGDPDGANPKRSVTLSGSSLYGTTVYGGSGDGTVFQLTSSSGYRGPKRCCTASRAAPATAPNPTGTW
jgi:uncharacterized repeat protein (TIGR03803 family)